MNPVVRQARRISMNVVLQSGSQFVPLIAGAVGMPLVYRNISHADFGVFTIALSALGLFTVLDLGLGRASVRFAARAFADRELEKAASIVAHAAILLGGFSLALCGLLFGLAPLIAEHWIRAMPSEHALLRQSLYILALALPAGGLTSVFRSVLEAREEFKRISAIQAVVGTTTYLVPMALSFATADVRLIIAGAVVCRIVAFFAYMVSALRVWEFAIPWHAIDLRGQWEFRRFSFWTVISNTLGTAIVYGDRALLIRLFGLVQVGFYNVPVELLSRLMIIVNSAATVVFPVLSRYSLSADLIDSVSVTAMPFVGAGTGLIFLILSATTPLFLQICFGMDFRSHSSTLMRVLLVGMEFQCLNVISLAILNARGIAKPITIMHATETPVYFAALYFGGERLGLPGVALVWSVRAAVEYVCFTIFQARSVNRRAIVTQVVACLLAALNCIPLALMASNVSSVAASGAGLVAVALCALWSTGRVRHGIRPQARAV
jgi:O-antigen/teichoic acid export membrane protein